MIPPLPSEIAFTGQNRAFFLLWSTDMKTHFSIIAIALLFSLHAAAGVFSFRDTRDQQVYRELLKEFPVEVRGFDQTKEKADVVDAFTADWKAYAAGRKPLDRQWQSGFSWSGFVNAFLQDSPSPKNQGLKDNTEKFEINIDTKAPHSIEDAVQYSEERVGGEIAKTLRKYGISAVVYGGTKETVADALKVDGSQIKYLPSPYDAWGIHKAFIPSTATADGKARYLMLIPPSKQYVEHYTGIFKFLDIPVESAIINHTDQRRQVEALKAEFKRVSKQLPAAVDVLSLGYYNVLQQNNDGLKAVTAEIPMIDGLTVQMLKETRVEAMPVHYLIVKSDKAIWGESSSLLVESALSLNPKAVIFMGSAGGIRETTRHYDISVPSSFHLNGRKIDIKNAAIESMNNVMGPWRSTVTDVKHGHTYSPIEQTKAYVETRVSAKVDSYDVEQNLIAETISKHNKKSRAGVAFVAINLITDKPKSFSHDWHSDHDLSRVNYELKSDARKRAVNLALLTVRSAPSITKNLTTITCDRAFAP